MLTGINLNRQQNQQRISFQSLKSSLRIGETVIKECKSEFPGVSSPSLLGTRILNTSESLAKGVLRDGIDIDFINDEKSLGVDVKVNKIPEGIKEEKFLNLLIRSVKDELTLERLRKKFDFSSPESYFNSAIPLIKQFGLTNCGDMAYIVQSKLLKKGIRADRISIEIAPKEYYHRVKPRTCSEHTFVVIDLAKNAILTKPKTWGSKAVIIDPWLGQCKPAYEMLLEYENFFKLDSKKERFSFIDSNRFDVDKYLKSPE